jgi:TPR repeat protein
MEMAMVYKNYIQNRIEAAEKGKAGALYDLDILYSIGHGEEQDNFEAHNCFNLAAMRGMISALVDRAKVAVAISHVEIS